MLKIDYYAYTNKLNHMNSYEKIAFSMGSLFLVLLLKNSLVSLVMFMVVSLLVILLAKIPFLYFCKLLILPFSFVILGCVSIVISVSTVPGLNEANILLLNLESFYLYFLPEQVPVVISLLVRSFSSICCLYFLILTTPVSEILSILHRWKVPSLLLEIIMLTYRYLFLLLDTATEIYASQKSRLGYQTIHSGFRSGGELLTALFIKTYQQAKELQVSIDSRGGGTLYDPVHERKQHSLLHIFIITIYFLMILFLNFAS